MVSRSIEPTAAGASKLVCSARLTVTTTGLRVDCAKAGATDSVPAAQTAREKWLTRLDLADRELIFSECIKVDRVMEAGLKQAFKQLEVAQKAVTGIKKLNRLDHCGQYPEQSLAAQQPDGFGFGFGFGFGITLPHVPQPAAMRTKPPSRRCLGRSEAWR